MRKLQLNEDVYMLPGEWNELTPDPLCYLIKLVNKGLSAEEIKLKMLLYCMKARIHTYKKTKEEILFCLKSGRNKYYLNSEELYIVSDIFSYLFFEENGKKSINPLMTENPFPTIKIRWKTYIGPEQGLSDMSYGQFIMLMTYFQEMQARPEALNDFIAIMYNTTSKTIKKLPVITKTALLWFYLGSMQFIADKFPITFSGGGSGYGTVFESQMRVVDALAKNDVAKKEIVKNALLYDALYTLEIAAEKAENQK
ncbi:hypothetical protein LJC11_05635 [Bacteroidales bacterium OttesenSCG-928-I21]|nr:hypothetical protein [Bacteroidales bacterium OttesenSCG-928-I21]